MGVPTFLRTAAIGLCVTSLVAVPALVAPSTARPEADKSSHSLTFVTKGDKIVKIKGTAGLSAGRISVKVKGNAQGTVGIVAFDKGYSFKKLVKDFSALEGPNPDMKALKTRDQEDRLPGRLRARQLRHVRSAEGGHLHGVRLR